MKTIQSLAIGLFLLISNSLSAQIFTTVIDEDALQFRVKQIDEFFVRFNYETDYKGDKPVNPSDKEVHKKNLLTVINLDNFSNDKNEIDSILNEFIDYVIDHDIKIRYEDTTWCAKAVGSLSYEGKKFDATFTLKTEQVKKYIYRWVITDIQSPLFKSFPIEPKDTISISPAEHGINFMTMPETFNLNKTSVGTAFAKGYKRSPLAVFDYLMTAGKIKVNTITKVYYIFCLENVKFTVERIEKDKGYNQGWLINEISLKSRPININKSNQ